MDQYWIRKISPIGKGRYRIELEDGFPFVLYKGELSKYGLEEDTSFPVSKYEEIRNEVLLKRCKMRAMHLLEKQDRLEAQLRDKLEDGSYPQDVIDETVDFLYSFHYLDDDRFLRNYISYYGQTRSRAEIVHALMLKGVPKDKIEHGFELLNEEDESVQFVPDTEKIAEILTRKHFSYAEADEKEKARMYRHLVGKGFRSEDILRMMRCE